MLQLPLHNIHREHDAHFAPYGEWELPAYYDDPLLEYQAVREGLALADLSHQGKFLITGEDRVSFLQNLISNDLSLASKQKGIYTCLLTAKGKLIADFFLSPLSDGLLMEIDTDNAEKTKNHLMRFRLRSKVDITSLDWGKLLLVGTDSARLIEKLIGRALPEMQENSLFEGEANGAPLICIKRSVTGESDFHLYTPLENMDDLWQRLMADGRPLKIKPIGQEVLEVLRVEMGKPKYGIELDEDIIPIEAGLQDEAISYTKGCFPGQEVIARIKTYGHVNKQLFGMILESDLLPKKGDKIFQNEKEVGWVTSAAKSPSLNKVIAMGYLKRGAATPEAKLMIEIHQAQVAAAAIALPFYQNT